MQQVKEAKKKEIENEEKKSELVQVDVKTDGVYKVPVEILD